MGQVRGWSESEFAALGEPYRERGARTTEYLEIFQACWAEGKSTYHGKFFDFEDMHVNPKPLQQPHPPIWVGGSSRASLRRAARFAEVWAPTPTPLPTLIENMSILKAASDRIGRKEPPLTRMSFRVNFTGITGNTYPEGDRPTGQGSPDEVSEDMLRYRHEAGLEAFQVNFNGCHSLQQLLDSMDLFTEEVMPRVAA